MSEKVGFPAKESLKRMVKWAVDGAEWIVALTPTTVDDVIVNTLAQILESDAAWDAFYDLLSQIGLYNELPQCQQYDAGVEAVSAAVGVNPLLIWQVVEMVLAIIKKFQK